MKSFRSAPFIAMTLALVVCVSCASDEKQLPLKPPTQPTQAQASGLVISGQRTPVGPEIYLQTWLHKFGKNKNDLRPLSGQDHLVLDYILRDSKTGTAVIYNSISQKVVGVIENASK